MRYRKKPVEVEARQFTTNNEPDNAEMDSLVEWIRENGGKARHDAMDIYIDTLDGTMCAHVGDYIIKGANGKISMCVQDIFEKTYEIAGA